MCAAAAIQQQQETDLLERQHGQAVVSTESLVQPNVTITPYEHSPIDSASILPTSQAASINQVIDHTVVNAKSAKASTAGSKAKSTAAKKTSNNNVRFHSNIYFFKLLNFRFFLLI